MRRWVVVAALVGGCGSAALAGASTASAAVTTLHVGGVRCSDSWPGSASRPFCTIDHAAKVAVAGQTVRVVAGTYPGPVVVAHSGTVGNPIVFTAASGANVTISGGENGFALSGRHHVTINGFRIAGTVSSGISVRDSSAVTITGNHVSQAGRRVRGQTAAGIVLRGTSSSLVRANTVDHNSDTGIVLGTGTTTTVVDRNEASENARGWQRGADGIDVTGPDNIVIGNVVHDNEDSGLQFFAGGNDNLATLNVSYDNGDHGIDDRGVTGGRLIGNTVYHNCTSGINVEGASGEFLVRNNIAVDNAVYPAYHGIRCDRGAGNISVRDAAPATTTVDTNEVWLSRPGVMYVFGSSYPSLAAMRRATGQERHGLQADPLFVDAPAGNFRLRQGSPAIDSAASEVPGEQATDILSAPRMDDPQTSNTGTGLIPYDDRGAYEFRPPVTTLRLVGGGDG